MKDKKKIKTLVIILSVALVLAALGAGTWYFLSHRESAPVNVYAFEYLGMTEYWGDSQESYGPVTTDRIQTVFLSDTQKVTGILVNEGDSVKKGYVLMTFDTTLTDIALERERLAVEKVKLQLSQAQEELREINAMKPMVITQTAPPETQPANKGAALSGSYQISQNKAYDGTSEEKALILWLGQQTQLTDQVLEQVRLAAVDYRQANQPAPTLPPDGPTTEPTDGTVTDPTESTSTESTDGTTTVPTDDTTTEPTEDTTVPPTEDSTGTPTENTTEPTLPPSPGISADRFFVVVKVTQDDYALTDTLTYQGMEVLRDAATGGFSFRFFDASRVEDHMRPAEEPAPMPQLPMPDLGSGFTASEIAQMRAEKEKTIRDLQFQVKMADSKYQLKLRETQTSQVIAQIDGTVVSLLTPEVAKETMQPVLKLSGGGGFYVEGFVSELEKDNMMIGQEVTINDWNTGMEYTGSVQSVGDFPARDGYWNGMGKPNASYYPFQVFVEETADLQEGSYVSVMYSAASAQEGIYLENPFLRTEDGVSYVYLRGADGKLEKRLVTTGKALWGSYTEVLDGLTPEDLIAFPYGKTVIEGADTVESDLSELYG